MTRTPRPDVTVVLPLPADPEALLARVGRLVAQWPADVDAELVVAAGLPSPEALAALQPLGPDVRVAATGTVEPTLGELCRSAAADAAALVLVLDDDAALDVTALRAALADGDRAQRVGAGVVVPRARLLADEVLDAALSVPALAALALRPEPVDPAAGEARLDPDAPVVPGLVSVVVPVWNGLSHTRTCLDSLRRTTRTPFEVVVVDNGSTDGTAAFLAAQPDVRVVTNAENLGFAVACNQGARAARGDVVVLLNNDTAVPRGWLEGLLGALANDPRAAAVGPRSNAVSGHQLAPGCSWSSPSGYRQAADRWRREHAGRVTTEQRLVGFCLALRREALLEVGLLDEGYGPGNFEDDDLCLRLRRAGWRLLVAHEVLVHHAGSATFSATGTYRAAYLQGLRHHLRKWSSDPGSGVRPLLSAALIVKDEQRSLAQCLARLTGLVDEVVVCDTGSSDRTVDVAHAFGARVVTHAWDDDFAAARDVAHAAARGTWVLSVDADELLVVEDRDALVQQLLQATGDGFALPVRSVAGPQEDARLEHLVGRLLRRTTTRWRGVVHEAPVSLDGERLVLQALAGVHLLHDGYAPDVYAAKDKAARNRALAERERARTRTEDGGRWAWKGAYELARVLLKGDAEREQAEELLHEVLRTAPAQEHARVDATLRLAALLQEQGRLAEAEEHARQARADRPADPRTAYRLALVLAEQDRADDALRVLDTAGAPGALGADAQVRDLHCEQVLLPALRARLLVDRELAALVREHSPADLAAAATALEAADPRRALALWQRLPLTAASGLARARCLAALGRLPEAAAAARATEPDGLDDADRQLLQRLREERSPYPVG